MSAGYRVVDEHYVMPSTFYDGKSVPPIEFRYAVVRPDGSRVFRAGTFDQADNLVRRLERFAPRKAGRS